MATNSSINHPFHYNTHDYECIDEMIAMFGTEAVIAFCKCNAWKYRYRADSKGSHDEDMKKSDWYVNKAMELQGLPVKVKLKGNEKLCEERVRELIKKYENHQPKTRHIAEF